MQNQALAIALVCAAIFLFGVIEVIVKYLGRALPVVEIAWIRYAIHALVMVAVFAPRLRIGLVRTSRFRVQLGRSIVLLLVTLLNWLALRSLPLAEVAAIVQVSPLLVTLLSVAFLRERVGLPQWLAVAVGFGGVLLLLRPNGELWTPVALLPLGAAACYALYQILTRSLSSEPPLTTLFYTALVGSLALAPAVPYVWVNPRLDQTLLLVSLGLVAFAAHLLFIAAYSRAPASVLTPFTYSQLIWATLFGALIFGNTPDAVTVVAMAVIAGSGLYVVRATRRMAPAAEPPD